MLREKKKDKAQSRRSFCRNQRSHPITYKAVTVWTTWSKVGRCDASSCQHDSANSR